MSLNADNTDQRGPALKLHRENWNTWIAKIKDYILALDHDEAADMWLAYEWVAGNDGDADPADHDYQTATSAPTRKLQTQHNKAYMFIRKTLSDELFDTTLQLPSSVPKLLRHLHKIVVSDGTVSDRARLRNEYQELTLEDSNDMQAYITVFKNKVHTLRDLKLGLVADDDDVLHQFNKGLPSAWKNHTSIVSAMQMDFNKAVAYYLKTAKDDSSLPGNLKRRTTNAVGQVHVTVDGQSEVCRDFAQGRCKRGDRCNYSHPTQPTENGGKQHQSSTSDTFKRECFYCGKTGHRKSECFKKERDDKQRKDGNRNSTHITKERKSKYSSKNESKYDSDSSSDDDAGDVQTDGFSYAVHEVATDVTMSMRTALRSKTLRGTSRGELDMLMVVDGASTVGVVESERHCEDVTDIDIFVKVGGEGKPNFLRCKRTAHWHASHRQHGQRQAGANAATCADHPRLRLQHPT
jgi:hypothetical protein